MFTSRRLIIAATAVAMLSGCASPNPYDNQGQRKALAVSAKRPNTAGWVRWRGLWLVQRSITIIAAKGL